MKPILGFPDYCITKDGQIWSKPRKDAVGHNLKGRWLKPVIGSNGYLGIALTVNSQMYRRSIHRLLLETFVGLCPKGMECRHLNGIRTDNRLSNLAWGTRSENLIDSIEHGTRASAKLTADKVRVIRYLYKVAKFTLSDLAWQFDVGITAIYNICRGISWKHLYAKV